MMNTRLQRNAYFFIAVAGLAIAPAATRAQEIDFEYRCVVVDTPSSSDQTSSLPASIPKAALGSTLHREYLAPDSGATNMGLISAYADVPTP